MDTFIEPFRIKSVEPITLTTREERVRYIQDVHYNVFNLHAEHVLIDLLTDSGTGAMSAAQWSALQSGDESYAGSRSFYRFEAAVKDLMSFKHIIPTHQGRAAERILSSIVGGEGSIIPNNTHFDTTRANLEYTGATAVDLLIPEGKQPDLDHPFKGNMDLDALNTLLEEKHEKIPLVFLTITNNAGGGQPVSMENIKKTRALCDQYQKPLFFDACRFAENAYFIKLREPDYHDVSVKQIVREMFSYADGMTMSAKKDGLVNMGGWLAMNNDEWNTKARNLLILTEGFPTYGGLSGRALETMAVGLEEGIQEDYLQYRLRMTAYLGEALTEQGVPIIKPVGGHAVFIDAKKMLPHIEPLAYPGQALLVALYETGGVRAVEIGSVMFGMKPDGSEVPAEMELVRLALPRRVYTKSHMDYVIETMAKVNDIKTQLPGYKIVEQPNTLRHFTAKFAPIE